VSWESELKVIERNPNYGGSRPRRLQRIVYEIGDNTRRTVDRIETADADYAAAELNESLFHKGGSVEQRFARDRAKKRPGPLLVQTPSPGFRYLQFNTGRGPLTDVRLRRALNYAIDRRALAGVSSDAASDAYLPPEYRSPNRAPVYPLSPDLARARTLLRGFRGNLTLYTCTTPDCTSLARIVRANLAAVGVPVRVKQFDDPYAEALKPGAAYDILPSAWIYDWPDPSNGLNLFFDPSGFRPPWAPTPLPVPARSLRELQHAAQLRGHARIAAYRRTAENLERNVAPFAAYATPVLAELFSARVGCRVTQGHLATVNIGLLCVR
jgi:ABC-type transport system substrate-binding protein